MNWTGGRLSRHHNAKGSLSARQKQHFDKVQASIRSAKKPSPLKVPIFDNVIEDYHQSSSSHRSDHHEESQTARPRRNTPYNSHGPFNAGPHCLSHSNKPQSKAQNGRLLRVKREPSPASDDDLYRATPQPWETKRKRNSSVGQSEKQSVGDPEEESDFDKRRRILRRGDWVGISIQRPLQLTFSSPKHGEQVGRRRKIADGHRARYHPKIQSLIQSPFSTRIRRHSPHSSNGQDQGRTYQGTADVRISIGGRLVPPGVSSGSAPSRGRQHLSRSYLFEQTQGSSSDVMLLDNDGFGERKLAGAGDDGISPKEQAFEIYDGRSRLHHEEPDPPRDYFAGNFEEDVARSTRDKVFHPGCFKNMFQTIRDSESRSHDVAGRLFTEYDHGQRSKHPDITRINQGQPIISSSTASLHHPKPRSSRTSLLLRSDSSEIAASSVATVGKIKPIVSSSQIYDNEIWESCVGPLRGQKAQPESDDLQDQMDDTQRISISPGVSYAAVIRYPKDSTPSEHTTGHFSLEESRPSKDDSSECSLNPSSQDLSIGNRGLNDQEFFSLGVEYEDNLPAKYSETQVGDFQGGFVFKDVDAEADQPAKTSKEPDPDEIWKKFVFGSGDDEFKAEQSHDWKQNSSSYVERRSSPTSSLLLVSLEPRSLGSPAAYSQTDESPSSHPLDNGSSSNVEFTYSRPPTEFRPSRHSTQDEHTSMHCSRDSLPSSISDLAEASMIVATNSQAGFSKFRDSTPLFRPTERIMFTKPKPFVGLKVNKDGDMDERKLSYLGLGLLLNDERDSGWRRKRVRGMYDSDQLEPIEDD
jgi:hypothetical protein